MAKPQLEDGHTRIANEILEHLMKMHLAPNQWQVLLCIFRKTYGFHKKVDYIANKQIGEATGLGKTVISRVLHNLNDMELITRKGKYIGFQKDWERWHGLAEQLTLDTKLAEQSTSKVSSIANQSKQFSQPGLAEQSTKVSSPEDTQKIKDTLTKDTLQKKGASPERKRLEFEDYIEELRSQFSDLDYDLELRKFRLYWSEGSRKLQRPKLALLNWMTKAREFKKDKGGQSGAHQQSSRGLPKVYRTPEEIYPDDG